MQTQIDIGLPLSVRLAHLVNRGLTFGMGQQERTALLAERLADWEEMHQDRGPIGVIFRSIRGVPAGIWSRLDDREITALPAALAIALLGLAGVAASLLDGTYPMDVRRFVFASAAGTLLLGATLIRSPRRVIVRDYRAACTLLSTGFVGIAFNMPTEADWPYDKPFVDAVVADVLMVTGFLSVGVGFAVVFVASFLREKRKVVMVAGSGIVAGTVLFAAGQIAWGIVAVNTDPAITAVSVGIGLASLSFAHVMPRLRKLQIV